MQPQFSESDKVFLGGAALDALLCMQFSTVLDIGSGDGKQAEVMRIAGKTVQTISLCEPADIIGDYLNASFVKKYDCIWASHVLEHQTNPGLFLTKCFHDLIDDGILAITVPPMKHEIVGGHVTLWNAGLLIYNLILAGFDCSEAKVMNYGYNISVIVRKKLAVLPAITQDSGDIARLAHFFPSPVTDGFNGDNYS